MAGEPMDREAKTVKSRAGAKPSSVKRLRARAATDQRSVEQRLADALAQQAATSEILRVMSTSPTDVQPVLDAVARLAARLCHAPYTRVLLAEGDVMRPLAQYSAEGAPTLSMDAVPLDRTSVSGRAALDRATVHHADIVPLVDSEFPGARANAKGAGFRAVLAVPLIHEGNAYGALFLWRPEPGLFAPDQVALVETFATQAAITIENVRLFHATQEALEQQTATSEILRVISSSPTDVQPVFDTIAERATKLCGADVAVVSRFDGGLIELAAIDGVNPEGVTIIRNVYPLQLTAETATSRAIRTSKVVHIADVLANPRYATKVFAVAAHIRGGLAVPMLREQQVIGSIFVGRSRPGLFADSQVELLKTFADQAVIAIENVRLFKELEARTTQLTRSVGELKALGEVGQAVSSTLDLETVLSTIVSRATQLAGVDGGSIYEYDEAREEFSLRTADRLPDELVEAMRAAPIRKGEGILGQMAMTSAPVQIPDIMDEGRYQSHVREILVRLGYRSLLTVPLLRENHLLGGLTVNRKRPGEFDADVIALLQTFASQSALAIQNARLFREIEVKGRQLEIASQHKSEFLANMSHELRTPLNAIIGFSEVLGERLFGEMNDKQAEYVGDITESGRHLLALINEILDLSKIEAGRMELDLGEFDLATTVDNTLALVRERAQRREITLNCSVDERIATIHADERKVKQVLLNLLSNALKFTPEGGTIDVRASAHDDRVEISVTDTGVGIAPEDLEAVFEEFRQVGTAAKKIEGTGLGLAISRKFIELHGGKIRVTSEVGKGATFAFTVPRRRSAADTKG